MTVRCFPDGRVPVVLSSHSDELLAVEATNIADYVEQHGVSSVAAVAGAVQRLRRRRRHRVVVRARDITELCEGLRSVAAGQEHPLVARSSHPTALPPAFVFPGNGNQWPGMGSQAYEELPAYRRTADGCAAVFVDAGVNSPLDFLLGAADDRQWSQLDSQSAQFTHAVALADVWASHGIEPVVTLGHSLGEIAAGYLAGAMTLDDAVAVVITRARALDSLVGDYGAASLARTVDEAQQLISTLPGWMELSVVNAASSVVVSGDRVAIDRLVAQVQATGVFARVISMSFPAHTSALDPLRDQVLTGLDGRRFLLSGKPFIGSVTAHAIGPETDFAGYWYRNLRDTVRFDRAVMAADGGAFVEVSAHPALVHALSDTDAQLIVGTGHRDRSLTDEMSRNIAELAVTDPQFPWQRYCDTGQPLLRGFPNTPMRAISLWARPEPLPPVATLTAAAQHWVIKPEMVLPLVIRCVAVIDLPGPRSPLAQTLRDAVRAHLSTVLVDAADADTLIVVAPMLDHPDTESSVQDLAELIDSGLWDYPEVIGGPCRTVWLVTVGGEHVRADEPVALPAQAALAAIHRSIAFEHPEQSFGHLDLPSWGIDDVDAGRAVELMLTPADELALRHSDCYTRTFADVPEPAPWDLGAGLLDDVVITGGNGAVGMHFARFLTRAGARRIVLLSRSGIAPEVLAELGPQVQSVQCDITSAEQLAAAAARHARDGATLVIHAAGAAAFGTTLSGNDLTATAHAKISGFATLAEHWPVRDDARMVLCSSVSGLWGGHGHRAYAAVNRMIDVMAGQQRAAGRHCVAVRWGLWPGDGIAGESEVAQIQRAGLMAMDAEVAVEAALRSHHEDPLLYSADPERLRLFLGDEPESVAETADSVSPAGGSDPETVVRTELAAALKLGDPAGIELAESLVDLGVDSLLALDLRKRLLRSTGRSVPLADLLSGITGTELVAALRAEPARIDVVEDKVDT